MEDDIMYIIKSPYLQDKNTYRNIRNLISGRKVNERLKI